jgi:hypothetical protein
MWIQVRDKDNSVKAKILKALDTARTTRTSKKVNTISAFVRLCADNAKEIIEKYA